MKNFLLFLALAGALFFALPASWTAAQAKAAPAEYPRQQSTASYMLPDYVTPIDVHGNAYAATLCAKKATAATRSSG